MTSFSPFDPLEAKSIQNTEVATNALKREILTILDSYVGWFDPFCELVQNSLDAVEEQAEQSKDSGYEPSVWITIDLNENRITITDNGTGLTEQKFKQFLAPDVSFKAPGKRRGHKGVGATYIAYGFNYLQVVTKTSDFSAVGKLTDAKKWLTDPSPAGNPQVRPDSDAIWDPVFKKLDHGTSITIKCDADTQPRELSKIKANAAETWHKVLSVKTGIGAFKLNPNVMVTINLVSKTGETDTFVKKGIEYLWPHELCRKPASFSDLEKASKDLFAKKGAGYVLPSSLTNLDVIYDIFDAATLLSLLVFDEDEKTLINKYTPSVYFAYSYSTKLWSAFNENLGIRLSTKLITGGIQIGADNMPQGDLIQIPLNKNIGVQHQVHIYIHFENCRSDLGRKGFHLDIVDFSKEVSKRLIYGPLSKYKRYLKPATGAAPDIKRENAVDQWKDEMIEYEKQNPIAIKRDIFFLPTRKISLTSLPTREQDVIALFNQMLAGGIIRGMRIMATNERFTYDSLYKITVEEPTENHLYHPENNPLGVLKEVLDGFDTLPFSSKPKVLEYKFSLDGLMEDLGTQDKNAKDIGLVVVWETGSQYEENYKITSLLDEGNLSERQYHGVTHVMTNLTTGGREMDLIVLRELIEYLNDPMETQKKQRTKYDA